MKAINTLGLGLGQRGFYFGLGLAAGLGFAAHGAAASVVSTACRGAQARTAHAAATAPRPRRAPQMLVADGHRWSLTLRGSTTTARVQGNLGTYHAHGKYVVVFLDAQNVGRAPQTIGFDQNFAVLDAQGRQFGTADSDATTAAPDQYHRDSMYEAVQPTFVAHLAIVFDVATDAHGLVLVNAPCCDNHTQKIFSLGL